MTLYVNQLSNKLIACNAGCYFNSMCINHVVYADDICLLAPTARAMQCYEYGTDNDILFNTIKSICTVSNQMIKNCNIPFVAIGHEALKYVSESKYLGFSSSDSKCDDCDMLRQLRSIYMYAKSNRLLRKFSNCSIDVKVTLFQSHCTALNNLVSCKD